MNGEKKTLRETVILGVFFLMLVTTYSSFSHIVTYITEHSDQLYTFEGEVVLILNFTVYLLGLTRAPNIRNYKRQFQIAALCYSINYALYLLKFNNLLGLLASILGAAIGGFGASVLWVSQGGYMMRLFKANGIQKDQGGYYLGIQNSLVFASSLIGAAVTTFGLGLFGSQIYFLVLTIIGLLAYLLCTFLLDPLSLAEDEDQGQNEKFTCREFLKSAQKVVKFIPKMKLMIAAMILDGLMLGFMASYFSHIIPFPIRTSLNLGFVLMLNGVGAIIGGYFSGYLSDKISPPQLGIAGFLFIILTLLLTLLGTFLSLETLIYPCLIGFLWGVSVNSLEGWIFVCCAKVYEGKIQTFAIAKQLHTISFILFQIYMIIVDNNINRTGYLITLIIMAIIALLSSRELQKIQSDQKHQEFVEEVSPTQ